MILPALMFLGVTVIAGIIIIFITLQFDESRFIEVNQLELYAVIIVFFAISIVDILLGFIFILSVLWLLRNIRFIRKLDAM